MLLKLCEHTDSLRPHMSSFYASFKAADAQNAVILHAPLRKRETWDRV